MRFFTGLFIGVVTTKYVLTENITILEFVQEGLKWVLKLLSNLPTIK